MYTSKTSVLLIVALFFTALHIQAQSLNGNYTVDPKGGGDFKTFNELEKSLRTNGISGPVTVDVLPGTYTERVTFSSVPGLSAKNPIVIQGDDPATTLLTYNTTSSSDRSVVRIQNLSYFTFRDIGVKSTGTSYGWGIHVYSSGTQVEEVQVINCISEVRVIGSSNYVPILFNGSLTSYSSSNRPFRNCKVDSCETVGGWVGIMFASNRNSTTAVGNKVLNTYVTDYYYYGMYLNSLYGFEVSGCTIEGGSTTSAAAVGIQFFNNTSSGTRVIRLNNNLIDHPGRYGIYLASAQGGNSATVASQRGQMFNNMIIMDGAYSDTKGIYTTSTYSGYFDIWHNSVVIEKSNSNKTSACIYFQGNYCSIMNNNLAYLASSGSAVPLYIQVPPVGLQIDYNNYYNNASNTLLQVISAYTATSFKGGGGYNQNSFNVNPNFVSSSDLHIKHTSAFPFGNSNSVTADFDGDKRCSFASSIGADQSEYSPIGKPAFKGQDSAYENSPAIFLNEADPLNPVQYTWSVDGKTQSKDYNFTYAFPGTGTYKVSLKTTTCTGVTSDSTVSITVVKQSQKPVVDFSLSSNVAEMEEELEIKDLSSNGPTTWNYTITPSTYYNALSGLMEPTYYYVEGDEQSPTGKIGFDAPGKYEICLIAGNSLGKDTTCKKEVVEVLYTDRLCNFEESSREVKGVLYDDGKSGPYGTNRKCSYLIEPCGGAVVLDFDELNLADGDFLRIYDGADNTASPLWDVNNYASGFTGNLTGVHLSLRAESGRAYVEFESDNSTTTVSSGFKLKWTIDSKTFTAPVAAFSHADTVCVDANTLMKNESKGTHNSYEWWVDGNLVSKDADVFEETFLFAGTYDVKLRAINCGGVDSVSKSIKVVSQSKPARAAFSASDRTPNVGEAVELWNMTTYCQEAVSWSIKPSTYQFENGTDAESNNPEISFLQPGCYDISLDVKNASGTSTRTKKCFIEVGKYCLPSTQVLSADIGIVRVSIDDIDRTTDANSKGYTSYASGTRGTLVKGASYPFEIERGGSNNNFSGAIWIDLDGDGTFATTEQLAIGQNLAGKTWKDTLKIPVAASSITTRMRIQTTSALGTPSACGPSPIGEYEDYTVTILVDNEVPEITLVGGNSISIEEGYGYKEPGFSAYDTQSGDLTNDVVVTSSVDEKLAGTYQITYNVEDEVGNKAVTVTRTVIVSADTSKPLVSLIGNAHDTIYVKDSYTDLGATATDVLDGVISAGIVTTSTLDSSKIGVYTITYSSTDSRNNIGTTVRYVTVLDSTKPTIALVGTDTVKHEILTTYTDLGTTVTDNHDDVAIIKLDVNTNLDTEKAGVYAYTICATDQSGNSSCITRYVDVADRTAPVLSLRGKDTIKHEVNIDFIDPWVEVSDNYTRNVTLTTGGDYDGTPDELGTFTIWYYATDDAGNKDSVSRVLEIVDTTPPNITLVGNEVDVVDRWEDYVDPGVTVSDNFDAVADITITTTGDFDDTQSNGRYFISYQAEDQNGNKSVIITRIVDVAQPTGVAGIDQNIFDLYPNPAHGSFVVRSTFGDNESLQLEVRDLAGRVLYSRNYQDIMELNTEISTANWTAGTYFVTLKTQNQQMVEKLSVIK